MSATRQAALESSLAEHARAFHARFGPTGPSRLFFAPGRVNLMGAHLDYNGGPVMPTAIDRGTYFAVRAIPGRRVRMASLLEPSEREYELDALPTSASGHWSDYPLGVLRAVLERNPHERCSGLEILFGGNLPVGAGLSSSASICVGTAALLGAMWGQDFQPRDWVALALSAERGFVGVQCGIMDPHAVGLARAGELLWLDCKDGSHAYLPLDATRYAIAVADTKVRRQLAQGAFNERVAECQRAFAALRAFAPAAQCLRDVPLAVWQAQHERLPRIEARRAEHVLREVQRTFVAREALLAGDVPRFGAQMSLAHASLRELLEVSVPELDHLVDAAIATKGVCGARLTGAGFGGCVVVLLERGAEEELRARLVQSFERRFGHPPAVELYGGDAGPREVPL
jgi:galactokinase